MERLIGRLSNVVYRVRWALFCHKWTHSPDGLFVLLCYNQRRPPVAVTLSVEAQVLLAVTRWSTGRSPYFFQHPRRGNLKMSVVVGVPLHSPLSRNYCGAVLAAVFWSFVTSSLLHQVYCFSTCWSSWVFSVPSFALFLIFCVFQFITRKQLAVTRNTFFSCIIMECYEKLIFFLLCLVLSNPQLFWEVLGSRS